MKSIKVQVKFPSASDVGKDLKAVLDVVKKNQKIDLQLDTSSFSASLNEMSNMLAKLKSQLGNFNILEQMDNSKIDEATGKVNKLGKEVEDLGGKMSNIKVQKNPLGETVNQVETYKDSLIQTTTKMFNEVEVNGEKVLQYTGEVINKNFEKFNTYIDGFSERIGKLFNKGSYSGGTISELQKELDSIKTNKAVDEVEAFDKKLKNLESNSTSINKVKEALLSANKEISNVGKDLTGFVNEADISKARTEAYKLSNVLSDLESGKQMNANTVKEAINSAKNSVSELRKNAEDTKKLLNDLVEARSKSETKSNQRDTKSELAQANAINKALEDEYKLNERLINVIERKKEARITKNQSDEQKDAQKQAEAWNKALESFQKYKEEAQSGLNKLVESGTFSDSYLKPLQDQFNSLNTDSSERELKEFNDALKDMVKLQKDVQSMGKFNEQSQSNKAKEIAEWESAQQKYITTSLNAEAKIQEARERYAQKYEEFWQKSLFDREQQEKASAQRSADQRIKLEKNVDDWWQKALYEREQKERASEEKLIQDKKALQQQLNTLYESGIIDNKAIDKLQAQLNSITAENAKAEIKKLNDEINNMKGSQSSVVKLEKEIRSLYNRLEANKNKYGELIKIDDVIKVQNEIKRLEQIASELRSGKIIDGDKIASETNKVKDSLDKVITSAKGATGAVKITNKEVMSIGQTLSKTLQRFGIYATSAMAVRKLFTEFKEGIGYVKELDSSLSILRTTMDGITESSLKNLTKQAQEMATELSSTTSKVMEAVTTFANMSETTETILNKTGSAIILSNLTGLDTATTVDTIQSATKQFQDLSDGSEESAMKVADSMVAISKSMGLDFTTGIEGMSESLSILGSLADQAKMDIDETLAVIGSGMEKLRMSGLIGSL